MRIVVTGSSGRLGRAIFSALAQQHQVIGIDRTPFSTTHLVGDFVAEALLYQAFENADAVIHSAALHAPHVGTIPDEEFRRINVEGTRLVAQAARAAGVKRIIFTSTTALYGHAVSADSCTWIDEKTPPQPKTIYHKTKLEAEHILENIASSELGVRILRMSRSFPEPADKMATYRLHRGIDIRDVADAHVAALTNGGQSFQRYIISAATPFLQSDRDALATEAASSIKLRVPELAEEFRLRRWHLPQSIDRVYDCQQAVIGLGWHPQFGFQEVLSQLDRRSLEILPVGTSIAEKAE